MVLFNKFFLLSATIWPKIRVHTGLFLWFVHDNSTKVYGSLSFTLSFVGHHLIKNIWSYLIYSFFCARAFDQKLRSTLIYFFICRRPFDQKLGSSLIYWFYLYATIRSNFRVLIDFFCYFHTTFQPNYRVFFQLSFLQCTTIRPKLRVHTDLFFYLHVTIRPNYRVLFHLFYSFFSARPLDQKLGSSLIYFFHLHTTIPQKSSFFHLLFFCAQPFDQKIGSSLIFCMEPFDKVRGHCYSFIYSFLRCNNLSFAMFMADTVLIFPSLCFWQEWQYYLYLSYTIIIGGLLLNFFQNSKRKLFQCS